MATKIGFYSLVEPACQVELGLRSEEQQKSCISVETNFQKMLFAVGMIGLFIYGQSSYPDRRHVEDEFGRERLEIPKSSKSNVKRGIIYSACALAAGFVVTRATKSLRMRQWRASRFAVLTAVRNPQAASYILGRSVADSAHDNVEALRLRHAK